MKYCYIVSAPCKDETCILAEDENTVLLNAMIFTDAEIDLKKELDKKPQISIKKKPVGEENGIVGIGSMIFQFNYADTYFVFKS